jgi:hypothetical protein
MEMKGSFQKKDQSPLLMLEQNMLTRAAGQSEKQHGTKGWSNSTSMVFCPPLCKRYIQKWRIPSSTVLL